MNCVFVGALLTVVCGLGGCGKATTGPEARDPTDAGGAIPVHYEWPLIKDNGRYSVSFVDEAGHDIDAEFSGSVAWDTGPLQQLRITTWDDHAKFRLVSDPTFQIAAAVVKQRLKSLTLDGRSGPGQHHRRRHYAAIGHDLTGTLSGDILAPFRLIGEVQFHGGTYARDWLTRLLTEDGEYQILLDDVGKKLSRELNGKNVAVQAKLTGKVSFSVKGSMNPGFSGTISSVTEIAYIAVISFEPALGK